MHFCRNGQFRANIFRAEAVRSRCAVRTTFTYLLIADDSSCYEPLQLIFRISSCAPSPTIPPTPFGKFTLLVRYETKTPETETKAY